MALTKAEAEKWLAEQQAKRNANPDIGVPFKRYDYAPRGSSMVIRQALFAEDKPKKKPYRHIKMMARVVSEKIIMIWPTEQEVA